MSRNRYALRADTTQPEIVAELEEAGIQVWVIGLPCDLLVRFYCKNHNYHCWQTIECKTPYGKKAPKSKVDKRQVDQIQFLADTLTPVVTNATEALLILSLHGRPKPA